MAAVIALLVFFVVIVFVGMVFVFHKILSKNVVSATAHLKELNQDFSEREIELNRKLQDIEAKRDEMMNRSLQEAEAQKEQILKEAQKEKEEMLKQAQQQAAALSEKTEGSRKLILSELDRRIAKEAVKKASELLAQSLPESLRRQIHVQWVNDLIENGFSQLQRLHIPKEIKEVKVSTPFELDKPQKDKISKKLKDFLKRDMGIKEERNPKMVAGIIVTVGTLMLDGSLENIIQRKAKEKLETEF